MAGRGVPQRARGRAPAPATERELVVVAAVLEAGSEKAAARRLGLSHSTVEHHPGERAVQGGAETTAQLVWILAPQLPAPVRDAGRRMVARRLEDLPAAQRAP